MGGLLTLLRMNNQSSNEHEKSILFMSCAGHTDPYQQVQSEPRSKSNASIRKGVVGIDRNKRRLLLVLWSEMKQARSLKQASSHHGR